MVNCSVFRGKESGLFFQVQHSAFFCVCEVLPHCNMKCTNEEVFLGKAKEALDDVNSEPTIADIASGFGCIISY